MANIYEQAQQFRDRLLADDRSAAASLTRSYGAAYERIQTDLDSVRSRLQELREQGVPANEWQYLVTREGRLQVLRTRVLDEISTFGQQAQLIIGGAIGKATEQGSEAALAMMDTALPAGIAVSPSALPGQEPTALIPEEVRLATGAIERVTAATQPAGAITQLLAGLAPAAADSVSDSLVSGIALGRNPRQIARDIRDALGGNLTRALTIARTETLRAYREASRAEYNANADVLDGWVWVADLSPRTCSACWAQHGSEHPLDEIMATHPNCRCTMAPLTKPWSELGFGDTPDSVRITPGRDEFKKLPAGDQRRILGDRTYAAWRGKQITLDDVVVRKDSPVWGPSASAGNVNAALRNAEARRADVSLPAPRATQVETQPADDANWAYADDEVREPVIPSNPTDGWAGRLADDEWDAVKEYAELSYDEINGTLRGQYAADARTTRLIGKLDSALDKAGSFDEPVTVWRGISFYVDPDDLDADRWPGTEGWIRENMPNGSTVQMDSFSSTSFDPRIALDFAQRGDVGDIILEIRARNGAYLNPSDFRLDLEESELLLPRNAKFRVLRTLSDVAFRGYDGSIVRKTIVQLEQL